MKGTRLHVILVAVSILLSSIIFGSYKKTLSASLGEIENHSYFAKSFCYVLDVAMSDPNHCRDEYLDYLEETKQ